MTRELSQTRRQYGQQTLAGADVSECPFEQFSLWFNEYHALNPSDSTAMSLATVDSLGMPDARVVLLKNITDTGFVFYTNYNSAKGQQIKAHPKGCLSFFWPNLARQIKLRGTLIKLSRTESESYFNTRPFNSRISAIVSQQSQEISSPNILLERFSKLKEKADLNPEIIQCPEHWGGYELRPEAFEFWQGRDDRLHERVHYQKCNANSWRIVNLAP